MEIFFSLHSWNTNVATIEQMSCCIRYFDQELMKFMTFCISFLLLLHLHKVFHRQFWKPWMRCVWRSNREQGYDGVCVMNGSFKGTQERLAEHLHNAIYVHCTSYCWNLAISDSYQVQDIQNCLDNWKDIFIPSYRKEIRRFIKKHWLILPRIKKLHLKSMPHMIDGEARLYNDFRWTSWCFEGLDKIIHWTNRDASTVTNELISSICTVKFMLFFFVNQFLFSNSILFQYTPTKKLDWLSRKTCPDDSTSIVWRKKLHIFILRHFFYKCKLWETWDANNFPKTNKQQVNRSNIDITNPESYYRISSFFLFMMLLLENFRIGFYFIITLHLPFPLGYMAQETSTVFVYWSHFMTMSCLNMVPS